MVSGRAFSQVIQCRACASPGIHSFPHRGRTDGGLLGYGLRLTLAFSRRLAVVLPPFVFFVSFFTRSNAENYSTSLN